MDQFNVVVTQDKNDLRFLNITYTIKLTWGHHQHYNKRRYSGKPNSISGPR